MKYTAGELAKKLGVSGRTIRFYDEKRLLTPCEYSEAGYRIYNDESAERLQKIIMLRFMDFSLEQISEMMQEEDFDVRKSLQEQENLLLEKKEHIERILEAVRKTRQASDEELWDNMFRIIDITKEREDVIRQYRSDDNLKKRISIHDYSTSEVGFYEWMFEKIALTSGLKVLDIGCGNAAFWGHMAEKLPERMEIHLVDYSDGMLASAKSTVYNIQKKYPEKGLKFVFEKRDATSFSYPVAGFDRIMANHMLYYINKESRLDLYQKINDLLAENGRFSCSLIGKKHLNELHELIREYYPDIKIPSDSFDIWLETAKEELRNFFTVVQVEEQENDLLVPEEELVFDYVSSYSTQAMELVSKDKEQFLDRVRTEKNEEGYMYIHKSTGIVVCGKERRGK